MKLKKGLEKYSSYDKISDIGTNWGFYFPTTFIPLSTFKQNMQ